MSKGFSLPAPCDEANCMDLIVTPRGALSLLLLQFCKLPLPKAMARQEWIQRLHDQAGGVPYGIALAAAALAVYPETGWMSAFGL